MKPMLAAIGLLVLAFLALPGPAAAQLSDQDLAERVAETVRSYSKFSIFDDIAINVDNPTGRCR